MASQSDIRPLLEKKLGVKKARLYAIAKDVSDSISISTSDAILLLSAKNGINLKKHGVPPQKIGDIRSLLPYLPQQVAVPTSDGNNGRPRTVRAKDKIKLRTRVKLVKSDDDPILEKRTLDEMRAMTPVYEVLYQLENSMRTFITRVLRAKHGSDWWEKIATRPLRDKAESRMADDKINAWHQKRSTEPIDYLDLDQLPSLIRVAHVDFVPHFFATQEWFQQLVEELYRSRCVVSHMNPLIQTNIDAVAVRFNQWQQLMKAKAADLIKLEEASS
jgi:hypothetical protein